MNETLHNPDRFMIELRQVISQGKKRMGLLIGAGAPTSVRVDKDGISSSTGQPLIPDIAGLTKKVLTNLDSTYGEQINYFQSEMGKDVNIEQLLTRIRKLAQVIGSNKINGLDGDGYQKFADDICKEIGKIVAKQLPRQHNPFNELVSWVGGTNRAYPIEIFTPNYDLLLEEAFERAQFPYFDGFTGSHKPFFDPSSVSDDSLPPRWSRLWKIHGSLGWGKVNDVVIRTGSYEATEMIYPEHLKYDQISRQPYSALFERMREFLRTPDSLLLCTGFSFSDAHITSVIDESLASNKHSAVIAFQYGALSSETEAKKLAFRRPNMSAYCRDGAVVAGIEGKWHVDEPQSAEWGSIRQTFWNESGIGEFELGDFVKFARFLALTQAGQIQSELSHQDTAVSDPSETVEVQSSVGIDDTSS